jgi:hypothetical protein
MMPKTLLPLDEGAEGGALHFTLYILDLFQGWNGVLLIKNGEFSICQRKGSLH